MSELSEQSIEKLNNEIQTLIFNKSDYSSMSSLLNSKQLSLQILITELFNSSTTNNKQSDILKSVLLKLLSYTQYIYEFFGILIKYKDSVYLIKDKELVIFILNVYDKNRMLFFKSSSGISVSNEKNDVLFLYSKDELYDFIDIYVKVNIIHESPLVYKHVFSCFLKERLEKSKVDNKSFLEIRPFLNYYREAIINNSVYTIRYLEMMLEIYVRIIKVYSSHEVSDLSEFIYKEIIDIGNFFFLYDNLTKLTILDLLESFLSEKEFIIKIIESIQFYSKINQFNDDSLFFNKVIRKYNYFLSKLYASISNLTLSESETVFPSKELKNLLSLSYQISVDNKDNNDLDCFIFSVYENIFHNENIFIFLESTQNHSFTYEIFSIIYNSYTSFDYKVKSAVLDCMKYIFLPKFDENYNSNHPFFESNQTNSNQNKENIQFCNWLLLNFKAYSQGKNSNLTPFNSILNDKYSDEIESSKSFFIDLIYKDFQKHDFEEYEIVFLNFLLCMFHINEYMYSILCNFEVLLYLLNKRCKKKQVCELKYSIISYVNTSSFFKEKAIEEIKKQFNDYVRSGVY